MPCSRSPVEGCAIPACIAGDIPACLAAGLRGGCLLLGEGVSAPGGVWSRGCLLPGVGCLLPGGVCCWGCLFLEGCLLGGGVAGEIEGDQVQAHTLGGN